MVQSCKSGRDFWIGLGSVLSSSKYFGLISGLHTKLFYSVRSTGNDFFISWCRFVVLIAVTSVSEVIVSFFQLIPFENTRALVSSLLGLVSHSWECDSGEEISTRWVCLKEINYSRDSWLVLRSLQAGLSCL